MANIDISKLVDTPKGFSGADIEGVVKDAVESVFANNKDKLTTQDLLDAINNTTSLSVKLVKDVSTIASFNLVFGL